MTMKLTDAKVGQKIEVIADNYGYEKSEKTLVSDQLIASDVLYIGNSKTYTPWNDYVLLGWKKQIPKN
jgi:hypothetical protein